MSIAFRKATKAQSRARIAIIGPAGSGKTYTALALATSLGQHVAVIDTERGSASKYADLFGFDVLELEEFDPRTYIAAIDAAQAAGYDVLVIDSLSHAWTGKGGVLDIKDAATRRSKSNDSFGAGWREASPLHNHLVDAMLQCRVHLLATMRTKTAYEVSRGPDGRAKVEKIGLAPVQRDGLEYEFDIVGDMDAENNFVVTKTRCPALAGAVVNRPDAKLAEVISAWLTDGVAIDDSGRADGDPTPLRPAGPTPQQMRQAQHEATRTRQRADQTLPTPQQIQKLRDAEDARSLVMSASEEYQKTVKRLASTSDANWRHFWWNAPLDIWKDKLRDAITEMSAAGSAQIPPGGPAADQASGEGRAGHGGEAGDPAMTPSSDSPTLTTESGRDAD